MTNQILSRDEVTAIGHRAHSFAQAWIDRGYKMPVDMWETAKDAAQMGGLSGRGAEFFCERAVGHWMNVQVGTRGV